MENNMKQENRSTSYEELLLGYMPKDNRLIAVYHSSNDDEDGSLCAGAYVVKKDFIDTLILARKNPNQIYELPDCDPNTIVEGKTLKVGYRQGIHNTFEITAGTGRPWHHISWYCTLDEIIYLYFNRDEEVKSVLKHNKMIKEKSIRTIQYHPEKKYNGL